MIADFVVRAKRASHDLRELFELLLVARDQGQLVLAGRLCWGSFDRRHFTRLLSGFHGLFDLFGGFLIVSLARDLFCGLSHLMS